MKAVFRRWALSGIMAALAVAMTDAPAVAKEAEFYLPLTVRILGAGGDRSVEVNSGLRDDRGLAAFLEQIRLSVSVGSGYPANLPPDIPAPRLTQFYEIVLIQDQSASCQVAYPNCRLPYLSYDASRQSWLPSLRYFYYPARGKVPAFLRIRTARVSEPVHEAWVMAEPAVTEMVATHYGGLQPISPQPQPTPNSPLWAGFGFVVLLSAGTLLLVECNGRLVRSPAAQAGDAKEGVAGGEAHP